MARERDDKGGRGDREPFNEKASLEGKVKYFQTRLDDAKRRLKRLEIIEKLENLTKVQSDCGNKKIEGNEDCDPPNTLCTTNTQEPGICTEDCECLLPGELVKKEEPAVEPEVKVQETVKEPVNVTPEVNESEEPKEEKKGFFARIWAWIKSIFS